MNKEYIAELENENLTPKNLIEVKHRMLTGNVIMLSVISAIILVTLVGIPRISIFAKIFKSISSVFQVIGLLVYFISTTAIFVYYLYIIILIIYKNHKGDEWVYDIYNFKKKTDIPSFTAKCLTIFLFLLIFFLNPCTVEGLSMYDTFDEGDKVICTDVFYYPKKNDVVIFDSHNYSGRDELYIKRVVATEGDKVSYENNILYINGIKEEIQRVDYSNFMGIYRGIKNNNGEYGENYAIVPKNMIVVLGDNRENSYDSGEFGPIKISDIYGKVIFRLYPFNKIRFF
ncbi:MAG: signal peptidase I [Acholeplasmatales bacterium]|nr:signal peptidase I [Acholeplasmatales bacterium]